MLLLVCSTVCSQLFCFLLLFFYSKYSDVWFIIMYASYMLVSHCPVIGQFASLCLKSKGLSKANLLFVQNV